MVTWTFKYENLRQFHDNYWLWIVAKSLASEEYKEKH